MVNVIINGGLLENIELFSFDKDGTIIDLCNYWASMIALRSEKICGYYGIDADKHKLNLMYAMGVDHENECLKPEGPVGILKREYVQKAAEDYLSGHGLKDVYDVCFKAFKEVDEESIGLLDQLIKPVDGALELLRGIKDKGGKNAIATTDKTERARLAVDFLGINDLIDVIAGADLVAESKPAPHMLNYIGEKLNIAPERSVMVGDAKTDILMGINAGYAASIAVCSGLTSQQDLEKLTPYVIEDVSKIEIN